MVFQFDREMRDETLCTNTIVAKKEQKDCILDGGVFSILNIEMWEERFWKLKIIKTKQHPNQQIQSSTERIAEFWVMGYFRLEYKGKRKEGFLELRWYWYQ